MTDPRARFPALLLCSMLAACSGEADPAPDTTSPDAGDVQTDSVSDTGSDVAEDGQRDSSDDPDTALDIVEDAGADGEETGPDTIEPDAIAEDTEEDTPVLPPADRVVGAGVDLDTLVRNGHSLSALNLDPLTHFSIGYVLLSDTGECTLSEEHSESVRGLVVAAPSPTLLLTVGGFVHSENFSAVAADDDARALFASSCSALVADLGVDGLEIDWSQPVLGAFPSFSGRPDDWSNYSRMLTETRAALDGQGEGLMLTMVGPADLTATPPDELAEAVSLVDLVSLVTYDFAGPWLGLTDLTAPLFRRTEGVGFSVDLVVSAWLEAGAPASKLVVGYPLYGWAWGGVTGAGLDSPSTGPAPGSDVDEGVYSWDAIRDAVLPGAERQWNEVAGGAWVLTSDDVFTSFDDPESVRAKAEYVNARSLAGLFGWSLGFDASSELPSVAREALAP